MKQFSIVSLLFLSLSFAACSAMPSANANANEDLRGVTNDSSFDLAPGQQVALDDGSKLRYDRLIQDSRCRPDVRCVWAGDAIVAFVWAAKNGSEKSFELHTGLEPRSYVFGSRKLALQSLTRGDAPTATLKLSSP